MELLLGKDDEKAAFTFRGMRQPRTHLAERRSLWQSARCFVLKEYIPELQAALGAEKTSKMRQAVAMQMYSKGLADKFSATKPPKPVDVLEAFLLESEGWRVGEEASLSPFSPGSVFFAEAFIDGDFRKHNSNLGWVGNELESSTSWGNRVKQRIMSKEEEAESRELRKTPQAFSHFTFEHSKGEMMVVDIQGVGDLFTDPQIHTRDPDDTRFPSGQGNAGISGMCLFFRTHICNEICEHLKLIPFSRCRDELETFPANLQGLSYEGSETRVKNKSRTTKGLSYVARDLDLPLRLEGLMETSLQNPPDRERSEPPTYMEESELDRLEFRSKKNWGKKTEEEGGESIYACIHCGVGALYAKEGRYDFAIPHWNMAAMKGSWRRSRPSGRRRTCIRLTPPCPGPSKERRLQRRSTTTTVEASFSLWGCARVPRAGAAAAASKVGARQSEAERVRSELSSAGLIQVLCERLVLMFWVR